MNFSPDPDVFVKPVWSLLSNQTNADTENSGQSLISPVHLYELNTNMKEWHPHLHVWIEETSSHLMESGAI